MVASGSHISDAELVCACQAGSTASFETLIKRHLGLVYAIGYAYLKSPEMADDLSQEVFLKVFLCIRDLQDPRAFTVWLSRIARNTAKNWQRDSLRSSRLVQMVPLECLSGEPEDLRENSKARCVAQASEERKLLRDAILNLPEEQREVVLLHFMEDLDKRAIAGRLGVHPSTVGRHINRALKSLHGLIDPIARQSFAEVRPKTSYAVRVSALIGAASLVSTQARSEMVALAKIGEISAVSSAKASGSMAGAIISKLAAAFAWLAGGAIVMSAGKGAVVVVLAVVCALFFLAKHQKLPELAKAKDSGTTYAVYNGAGTPKPISNDLGKKLLAPISVATSNATELAEMLELLSKISGVPISLDAGIKMKVEIDAKDKSLSDVLNMLLARSGLAFTVEGEKIRVYRDAGSGKRD